MGRHRSHAGLTLFDWLLSHDTWKPAAELAGDWKTIGLFLLAIAGALWRWRARLWRWLFPLFRAKLPALPGASRSLCFVTDENQSTWSVASSGDRDLTHVHGKWHVTNVSNRDVKIVKARIEGHEAAYSRVATRAPDRNLFELGHPIPAHRTSEVFAILQFYPSIVSNGDWLAVDVVFTDNYAGEHRVPSVRFRYMGPLKAPPLPGQTKPSSPQ
jgi:hypothetical protein